MAGCSRPRRAQGAAPETAARASGVVRRRDHKGIVPSLLAVAAALALAGCGVHAEADSGRGPAAGAAGSGAPSPRTYTIEQLAATVGCTAKITLKGKDYRQGECTSDGIPYVFLDFDAAQGQREWLDYAEMYGGVYLAGDRWVLSAKSKEFMGELSKKLGGTVEENGFGGSTRSPAGSTPPPAGPTSSPSQGHHH